MFITNHKTVFITTIGFFLFFYGCKSKNESNGNVSEEQVTVVEERREPPIKSAKFYREFDKTLVNHVSAKSLSITKTNDLTIFFLELSDSIPETINEKDVAINLRLVPTEDNIGFLSEKSKNRGLNYEDYRLKLNKSFRYINNRHFLVVRTKTDLFSLKVAVFQLYQREEERRVLIGKRMAIGKIKVD